MWSILLPLLLGAVAGALVNYLADVLPRWRRLVAPRCLNCGEAQTVWNYFLWPRRCPHCRQPRRRRSIAVELALIGATIWIWRAPPGLGFWFGFVILIFFAVVVLIDLEHRLILHPVSAVGALLGALAGTAAHGPLQTALGGVAGFTVMLVFYYLGTLFVRLVLRAQGQAIDEVALGFGDVTLSGILGLMLGWPNILMGLLLAILAGGAGSLVYVIVTTLSRRYRRFAAIPYAPYLVLGAALLLYLPETAKAVLLSLSPMLAAIYRR